MQSKFALSGRRINNFIVLWCPVASGGLDFCVSSTSFQKNDIPWPQQPPTEKLLKFNIIFHDSTKNRDCWGQPMLLFWNLVDATQNSKPPEATKHHNSKNLLILLPLRADLLCILHYETPCTIQNISLFLVNDAIKGEKRYGRPI